MFTNKVVSLPMSQNGVAVSDPHHFGQLNASDCSAVQRTGSEANVEKNALAGFCNAGVCNEALQRDNTSAVST
jgi:hypothetical protein